MKITEEGIDVRDIAIILGIVMMGAAGVIAIILISTLGKY